MTRLVLALALVASAISICEARTDAQPLGYWVRMEGHSINFTISRGSKGAWVVETHGTPEAGAPSNACLKVFVGTLIGTRLVSTSDLNRDFEGVLKSDGLIGGEGLFIDFDDNQAHVYGPEATGDACALEGNYTRPSGR
jgi:hypothetical protein